MNLKASILWISLVIFTCEIDALRGPSKCCRGPNEVYTDCGPSCGGDGCAAIQYFQQCNQTCQAGCFCKCGFFRNSKGICVRAQECPGGQVGNVDYPKFCPGEQCCGDFEYFGESNSCVDQCPLPNQSCILSIEPGCYCLPGYSRNRRTGKCIPDCECPEEPNCAADDPNSELGCGKCDTCTHKIRNKPCPNPVCPTPSCKCKEGFFRDDITGSGKCVPLKKCESLLANQTCPKNEEPGCAPCKTCEDLEKQIPGPCKKECPLLNSCKCKEGLYRNSSGICVPANECKKPVDCPPNESYAGCGNCESCANGIDKENGRPPICPQFCKIGNICKCKQGFYRNKKGQCVTVAECKKEVNATVCGPNETLDGCGSCQSCIYPVSEALNTSYPCKVDKCVAANVCKCKKGYFRNSKGECVTRLQCLRESGVATPNVCKGPNESNFGCGHCQKCSQFVAVYLNPSTPCTGPCSNENCICLSGFYRNKKGDCVTSNECLVEAGIVKPKN